MKYIKLPGVYHGKKNHPLADKKQKSPAKSIDASLIRGADTTAVSGGTGGTLAPGDPWKAIGEKNRAIDSAEEVTDPDTGEVLAKAGTYKAYKMNQKSGVDDKSEMEDKYVTDNNVKIIE